LFSQDYYHYISMQAKATKMGYGTRINYREEVAFQRPYEMIIDDKLKLSFDRNYKVYSSILLENRKLELENLSS